MNLTPFSYVVLTLVGRHGATAPERPCIAVKDPVSVMDLHATILTAMGISPRTAFDVEKRPFHATEDGKGKSVHALFA